MKAIYFTEIEDLYNKVYAKSVREKISKIFDIKDICYNKEKLLKGDFKDVEYIFGTWGFASLTEEEIKKALPNLKAVFYAAGTVQSFARPFLKLGIKVFSAWQANAVPVIQFSVSEIMLAAKGYYQLQVLARKDWKYAHSFISVYPGNYNTKIGILGYGAIGKGVVKALVEQHQDVYVFAPNLTVEEARQLGIHKVNNMEEIFDNCVVISNHMANLPTTQKLINKDLINRLKDHQTFINTGRGQQVDEMALLNKCKDHPMIAAVLDVLEVEPPVTQDSLFFKLPNVFVTPHIAGSSGNEVVRMAEYMLDESKRYLNKESLRYEVTMKMLETMA